MKSSLGTVYPLHYFRGTILAGLLAQTALHPDESIRCRHILCRVSRVQLPLTIININSFDYRCPNQRPGAIPSNPSINFPTISAPTFYHHLHQKQNDNRPPFPRRPLPTHPSLPASATPPNNPRPRSLRLHPQHAHQPAHLLRPLHHRLHLPPLGPHPPLLPAPKPTRPPHLPPPKDNAHNPDPPRLDGLRRPGAAILHRLPRNPGPMGVGAGFPATGDEGE